MILRQLEIMILAFSDLRLMVCAPYLHFPQSRTPRGLLLIVPRFLPRIAKFKSYRFAMARTDHSAVLLELRSHRESHPLSILKLAEPIINSAQNALSPSKRASDISNSEIENPTPANLEADLLHYKVRAHNVRCGKLGSRIDAWHI